ncbi:MAG: TonB-dependent receptor [Gammaproteobacteria bacterium]|nr:TonB-dependent receptor [Pseudomonadales bacterium]MCP5348194.1 TonB-dependent receptor [Pseudomonadales bacterium]
MFKHHPSLLKLSSLALAIGTALGTSPLLQAQGADESIEEVVVTGSRGRPRTVVESPVPVDVFGENDIEAVSYSDTNNILQTLVPSYNVDRAPISDGGTMIRTPTLRSLPTDKTLVLVNSKRRHRAALVSIGGSGTQGPDVATIPSSAIKNVEVLRDGAAAQYGSDAIAGVINFILKDNDDGGSLSIDTGQFYEGDGDQITVQGNIGLPLGQNGFLSLSGEYWEQDYTSRGVQYCQSYFCVDPSLPGYNPDASYAAYVDTPSFQQGIRTASIGGGEGKVVQPWGQPQSDAIRMFFNSGIELSANSELYAYGNYTDSSTDGNFFYRYPENGTIEELRTPDGGIYTPLSIFPGGFTPQFFGDITDYSLATGIRGAWDNGLTYDFSGRYGYNEISYSLKNTVNPSMGPDSPTSFKPGDLINIEGQLQADFTYEFDMNMPSPLLLAFGASWMDESYEVAQGGEASYIDGPYATQDPWGFCNDDGTATAAGLTVIGNGSTLNCADSSDPVYKVVGVGANGFPGYSPQFADVYERNSYAVYADLSADVTDNLFLQAAMRYENYDDFDPELVGKLAGRLAITDTFGMRASVGTGFRAPTPGQQGTVNVSTRLPDGFPVATGLFPAGGPVARALGAVPLKPELSTNYTLGFTAAFGDLDLTLDFYRIDMDDRMNAISTQDVSTDPTSGAAYDNYLALKGAGVAGAETIGGVFYFTNAYDTRNQGADLVATLPVDWGDAGTTRFTGSLNYNKQEYRSEVGSLFNAETQYDFENFDPNWRGVFTANHSIGDLTLIGRLSWYGESSNSNTGGSPLRYQTFNDILFTDLEAQYQINDMFRVSVGGRNIFDEYPGKDTIGDYCCGRVYSSGTVVDWQGGYYFARLTADFN